MLTVFFLSLEDMEVDPFELQMALNDALRKGRHLKKVFEMIKKEDI